MSLSRTYNTCAEDYAAYVTNSLVRPAEMRALRELLGPLQGRRVVDLACGDGCFGRDLLQHGAASVLGVDLTPAMVASGQRLSAQAGDGMQFMVGDVLALPDIGTFDIAIAAWLLCHAETSDALHAMYRAAASLLAPGGCFVAHFNHPWFEPLAADHSHYGVQVQRITDGIQCPRLRVRFLGDAKAEVIDHQWSVQQHEDAARAAGLQPDGWAQPVPDAAAQAAQPRGFWDDLLGNSMSALLRCRKPAG